MSIPFVFGGLVRPREYEMPNHGTTTAFPAAGDRVAHELQAHGLRDGRTAAQHPADPVTSEHVAPRLQAEGNWP